jgi:FkbM family methyltransferase
MKVKKLPCRHGTFSFYSDDEFVGRSLELYGEYSPDEISIFNMVLRPGDVAVEVGSNIGALTVPMARLCKRVYAFEAQPENFELLKKNLRENDIDNVSPFQIAISDVSGATHVSSLEFLGHHNFGRVETGTGDSRVELATIDHLLRREMKIKFIKIDVEGGELEVLRGAADIIKRDRPLLYVENDRQDKSAELVGWLIDNGYRCFWHRPPLYYENNFRNHRINAFGNIVSLNMICYHEDTGTQIDRLEEVDDHRVDPEMHDREAARALRRLDKNPNDLEARFVAAHYTNLKGEVFEARKLLAENLKRDKDHVGTRAIQGLMDLQAGNFADGWPAYELRYSQHEPKGFGFRVHDEPHWDGSPTDKRILIWSEQGFGDSIMFVRFMKKVLELAPNAILEVQPQLFELFELSDIVSEDSLFRVGRVLPVYDYHCSIPSLPAALGLTEENQLHVHSPYLFADQKMVESWKKRDAPRIGVCLKGGAASERAYSRDMPQELMEPLARDFGPFMSLENLGQWESYADTAAAIMALDLVLTVDTSIAHLSGALGKPTWLMLSSDPDWRWQRDRTDTPWYPTMRIFRQQQFMNWKSVVEEVAYHLETRVARAAE